MRIFVTKEDIASGCRFSTQLCPVALALTRSGLYHLGVFGAAILLESQDCSPTLCRLPSLVADWIASFDGARPVSPVTFDIDLPANLLGTPVETFSSFTQEVEASLAETVEKCAC